MNGFSVPLSYRQIRQIQQVSNEANLESKSLLATSNKNYPIQVKNRPPSDVEETDLNSDSLEKEISSFVKIQGKENLIQKSLEQDRVTVSSPTKAKNKSIDSLIPKPTNLYEPLRITKKLYNSYPKYHPKQLLEISPEGQMAILSYLLDMRTYNNKLKEVEMDKVT